MTLKFGSINNIKSKVLCHASNSARLHANNIMLTVTLLKR